jgi:hypothetical protein
MAERAQVAVDALALPHAAGVSGVVTVSVGRSRVRRSGRLREALLARADAAL